MGDFMIVMGVGLIGLALFLFVLEQFIPTAGLLGFAAAVSAIAGVVLLFRVDTRLGMVSAIIVVVAIPVLVVVGAHYFPESPVAQMLTLTTKDRSQNAEMGIAGADTGEQRAHMIGKQGVTLTDLKPTGFCKIDGQRIECTSDAGFVEAGTDVVVTAVDGVNTRVRSVS